MPRSSVFIIEGFRDLEEVGGSGAGSVEGFVFSLKHLFAENERWAVCSTLGQRLEWKTNSILPMFFLLLYMPFLPFLTTCLSAGQSRSLS